MIKNLLLPLLGLGLAMMSTAQSLSPSVIASNGTVSQGNQIQLEWTLGELAIQSLQTTDGLLTEGFHQPNLLVEILDVPETDLFPVLDETFNITVAPNPVQSTLYIQMEAESDHDGVIRLSDYSGQRLKRLETEFSNQTLEWDLSPYPSGIYLLSFYSKEGRLLKQYKVSKVD